MTLARLQEMQRKLAELSGTGGVPPRKVDVAGHPGQYTMYKMEHDPIDTLIRLGVATSVEEGENFMGAIVKSTHLAITSNVQQPFDALANLVHFGYLLGSLGQKQNEKGVN